MSQIQSITVHFKKGQQFANKLHSILHEILTKKSNMSYFEACFLYHFLKTYQIRKLLFSITSNTLSIFLRKNVTCVTGGESALTT